MSGNKIKVRMGQLIYPWGVGAIIPLPGDKSGIIAGLDDWDSGVDKDKYKVNDDRLAAALGAELRLPPFIDKSSGQTDGSGGIFVPYYLFPTLYYCPNCGRLYPVSHGNSCVHCVSPGCSGKGRYIRLVPERFVVICSKGHIDNLPILEIFHNLNPNFDPDQWLENPLYREKYVIERRTGSKTSLAGISYVCKNLPTNTVMLSRINSEDLLKGYQCHGNRPWLGKKAAEECDCSGKDIQVVQRGGTNVWFPLIESSIFIPTRMSYGKEIDEAILEAHSNVEKYGETSSTFVSQVLRAFFNNWFKNDSSAVEKAIAAYHETYDKKTSLESDAPEAFKFQEFEALSRDFGSENDHLIVHRQPISSFAQVFDEEAMKLLESISLVHRLEETRALVGFSRINPPDFSDSSANFACRKLMSKDSEIRWLPAVKNGGEGIFIKFDDKKVIQWSNNADVKKRIGTLIENAKQSHSPRRVAEISPSYVLIHTFAHILINELSKSCGYGSSSIRERIYVCDGPNYQMHGVLIYTSSSGSDASLGGLVRLGKPSSFAPLFYRALQEAVWCSSDPLCINSNGQGPDSVNLAACHNCALLPETCCENGNRYLDRALVVGKATAHSLSLGYFQGCLPKN